MRVAPPAAEAIPLRKDVCPEAAAGRLNVSFVDREPLAKSFRLVWGGMSDRAVRGGTDLPETSFDAGRL
jgi:hypothetical protein